MPRIISTAVAASVMAIVILATKFTSTMAYGYMARAVIAEVANQQNATLFPTLQPIFESAYAGFYPENEYTHPALAAAMPENMPFLTEMLGFNQAPFNVANDPSVKPVTVSQTNSPWQSAQLAASLTNRTSVVWAKAENLVSLLHLVPTLSNPERSINFYSDAFLTGDDSGKLFEIDFTSAKGLKYHNLFSAVEDVFGLQSPSGLDYSAKTMNKTTRALIAQEAQILTRLFPLESFPAKQWQVPEKFTTSSLAKVFRVWTADSYQVGMQIYNSFLNYPKSQPRAYLESDMAVSSTYSNQWDSFLPEHQLYPSGTNGPEGNDPLPIAPEQLQLFRYLLLKQLALAGYRLASVLKTATTELSMAPEHNYPMSYVSALWRAGFMIATIVTVVCLYMTCSFACKQKKRAAAADSEEALITAEP